MAGLGMIDQAVKSINTVEEYVKVGMEMATEGALDFLEYNNNKTGDVNNEKIDRYRQVLMEFVKLESEIHQIQDAVKDLPTPGDGTLEKTFEKKLTELQRTSGNKHDRDNNKLAEFNQKISEYTNTDGPEVPGPSTSGNINEDDVEMTQEHVNTKCPYTGMEMVFPMKNKICGHMYDRDGIATYMQQRKKKAKCPLGGCSNDKTLEMSDLEENPEMRRYIERMNRSKKHKK